jgi:hypothetical protein
MNLGNVTPFVEIAASCAELRLGPYLQAGNKKPPRTERGLTVEAAEAKPGTSVRR